MLQLCDCVYDCIWSNLSLAHTPFYFSYSYRLLSHPLHFFPPFCPAHTQQNISSCKSVYWCGFAPCMCVSSGAQCFILGLNQASAPEDCRLMWPISSDYPCMVTESLKHTCIHMHSGKKKRITARKSLRMWFTHLFIFVCFVKSAYSLSLCFPFLPSLFPSPCSALCIFFTDPSVLLPCIIFFLFLNIFLPCFFLLFPSPLSHLLYSLLINFRVQCASVKYFASLLVFSPFLPRAFAHTFLPYLLS